MLPQLDHTYFISQIFWLITTFLVLYLVFSKVILPKIRDILQQRNSIIDGDTNIAKDIKIKITKIEEESKNIIQNAKAEASEILSNAHNEATSLINSKINELKDEINKKLSVKEQEIISNKKEMINDANKEIIEIVTKMIDYSSNNNASHYSNNIERIVNKKLGDRI